MDQARVCSVVVTFHPGQEMLGGVRAMRTQVQGMVVIDNGSGADSLAWLRSASAELDFTLIEAGENLGIAAAQNRGLAWAQPRDFDFVLFFDQDSSIPDGFVPALLDGYARESSAHRIAVLAPRYRDSRLGSILPASHTADGHLELAMSSGSLIPLPILRDLGGFEESLFIDFVDYEFCLRARRAGYVLRECPAAILDHAPANPLRRRLFSLLTLTSANYPPSRRYYLGRNLVWMLRHYAASFPAISLRFLMDFLKDALKILLIEAHPWAKTRASLRGIADGLGGRMGPDRRGIAMKAARV